MITWTKEKKIHFWSLNTCTCTSSWNLNFVAKCHLKFFVLVCVHSYKFYNMNFFSLKNEYPIQAHIRLLSTTTCNLWLPLFYIRLGWLDLKFWTLLCFIHAKYLSTCIFFLYNITYMLRKYVLHYLQREK